MARRSIRRTSSTRGAPSTRDRRARVAGADLEVLLGLPVVRQQVAIEDGLPFPTIERLGELLGISIEEVGAYLAISRRTLARRKAAGSFDALESDRMLRIARVFFRRHALFDGEVVAARRWLAVPRHTFGSRTALEFAATEVGVREVEAHLGRLAHGVFP